MQTVQIKVDGTMKDIKPSKNKQFKLLELQELVNGMIELVNISKHRVYMVVNEDGKILDLPINVFATALYDEEFGKGKDYIVGDVVLIQYAEFT